MENNVTLQEKRAQIENDRDELIRSMEIEYCLLDDLEKHYEKYEVHGRRKDAKSLKEQVLKELKGYKNAVDALRAVGK